MYPKENCFEQLILIEKGTKKLGSRNLFFWTRITWDPRRIRKLQSQPMNESLPHTLKVKKFKEEKKCA